MDQIPFLIEQRFLTVFLRRRICEFQILALAVSLRFKNTSGAGDLFLSENDYLEKFLTIAVGRAL